MATRTRIAIFAGLAAAVAGFDLITAAWDGTASRATSRLGGAGDRGDVERVSG